MNSTLGIIGCGKMGRALLGGILEAGLYTPENVTVFDAYAPAVESFVNDLGVVDGGSNAGVLDRSETVLLCVKPQTFPEMLASLGDATDRLLISIAAGVKIATIESATSGAHRVIRVMPNTPALVQRGASAYSLGTTATADDSELARQLLGSVGYVTEVPEKDQDAVTAVSGSGPAYFFLMVEALVQGGIDQGLDPTIALDLARNTALGAAELLVQTGEDPGTLRENVTSPNGTTFAALESFREAGFPQIVRDAVKAATDRSVELGQS